MRRVKVIIVEDEWIVSEEIKLIFDEAGYEVVGQAEDAIRALEIIRSKGADVAVLDINLKGSIDGISLAEQIRKEFKTAVIFLTASADPALVARAKKVRPHSYLVKPFNPDSIQVAVDLAFDQQIQDVEVDNQDSYIVSDYIFLKENSRFKKISVNKIWYAKAVGSYTDIFSDTGRSTLAINLKTFEASLKDQRFLRIHRSYLVNTDHIEEFEGNQVYIRGQSLPISASHKEELLRRFRFI